MCEYPTLNVSSTRVKINIKRPVIQELKLDNLFLIILLEWGYFLPLCNFLKRACRTKIFCLNYVVA